MKFLSVCSGIEAASVAWAPLGWEAVAFSEIEPFPCAVLHHHYPHVPNWGDMTKYKEWPDATIDLLSGGTPCQSFSVAGLRKGLDDPRGNLMLTFGAIAERYRPRWLVWENVPGVLSSNSGRDFGTFLGMLGQLGYGFAYRVLDAQYFGVAQRRRRVFVVGYLGDWRPAAAVLFEQHSLSGHPAPRREAGQRPAPSLAARTRGGGGRGDAELDGALIPRTANAITASMGNSALGHNKDENVLAIDAYNQSLTGVLSKTVASRHDQDTASLVARNWPAEIAPTLNAAAATQDQWLAAVQAVAFAQNSRDEVRLQNGDGQIVGALAAEPGMKQTSYVAFQTSQSGVRTGDVHATLDSNNGVVQAMQVRRLTPIECERLQGFPDGYTAIPWRKKPASECPDGPRYKALGNSWAVPCAAWIGMRINQVMEIIK